MGDLRRRILLGGSDAVGYISGVYAYYSDGSLRTYEKADTDAIGVAVITTACQFVIDKTKTSSSTLVFGGQGKDLSSAALVTSDVNVAITDYLGETNTTKVISALSGYTDNYGNIGAPAAEACRAKFGGLGYMGALGEWQEVLNNKDAIISMMSKIGGDALAEGIHHSSTQYNTTTQNWRLNLSTGDRNHQGRRIASYCRAFLKIHVPILIDLGLPSGTLWAAGNICKDSDGNYYMGNPTDRGCYFSWGNIIGHNKGEGYNFSSSNYNSTPGASLTADIASNDSAHDAALACLGTGYRMPTKAEFDELIDNCTVTWVTSYNGVSVAGRIFKSNIAGYMDKEIFIPAFGCYDGTSLYKGDSTGYYWSSTYNSSSLEHRLGFDSGGLETNAGRRYFGTQLRAVKSK